MRGLMLLLALWLIGTARAQDLEVVATSPGHGSAGVDPATAVSITFNKAINPADSLTIFPLDSLLQEQLSDPTRITLSPDGKTITFQVTHQPDRDYTWVVHYAKGMDGSRLGRRYVLHYTTAAEAGPYTVSGQIVEQSGPGKQLQTIPRLRSFHAVAATSIVPSAAPSPSTRTGFNSPHASVSAAGLQSSHLGNWYVALFPTSDPNNSEPVRLAVTNPDGTFSIEFVRPGTYYLWAFFFAFNLEEGPLGFGSYDPNGDLEPDPLQVSGELSGLTVPVILLEPITALQAAQIAGMALMGVASDAQIVMLMGAPDESGRALSWGFTAYSPSKQTAYQVYTWGPIPAAPPNPLLSPAPYDQMAPLPLENMVDSDVIVAAFRNRFPATGNTEDFLLQAGQLARYFDGSGILPIELYPLDPAQSIWLVQEFRALPPPLLGTHEYDAAYDLSGTELAAYEPATAIEALQTAWQQVAPAKRTLQSDGIVSFSAYDFNPYDGTASTWTVEVFAGGQAFRLHLSNTLVTYIDTLDYVDWAEAPKIPFPGIIDSGQAADTARAHSADAFLNNASGSVWAMLEGGFLGPAYSLNVDPTTPLYGLFLFEAEGRTGKRAPLQPAQASARYFVHMVTGAFIEAQTTEPFTARTPLAAVRDSLTNRSAELKRIFSDAVRPDGRAPRWDYHGYRSADTTQIIATVAMSDQEGGLTFGFDEISPPYLPVASWPTLPESFIDSDSAMATAMANGGSQFMETHDNVWITMEGRAMPDRYPHLEGYFIWEIIFRSSLPGKHSATVAQTDSLVVLVDMETGNVLPISVAREIPPKRARLLLQAIYPNPATHEAVVVVQVPRPERIRLVVYNLLGQEVARLIDGPMLAGEHRLRWSVRTLPAGLYLLRLQGPEGMQTLPLVVAH